MQLRGDEFSWPLRTYMSAAAAAPAGVIGIAANPAQQQLEASMPHRASSGPLVLTAQPLTAGDQQLHHHPAEQQAAGAATAAAGPHHHILQSHQQQDEPLTQIAELVAAAADEALQRRFTNRDGDSFALANEQVYQYQGQRFTHVDTRMPCFPDQVTRCRIQSSDGSISCSFEPHSHLSFHKHALHAERKGKHAERTGKHAERTGKHAERTGAALANPQPTVEYWLQNGNSVLVTLAFSVGGPESWPPPKAAGSKSGLWTMTVPGTCTIKVTHPAPDSRKRKKQGEVISQLEVDFQRIVVLRSDECHRAALQRLQLGNAGNYWREWTYDPPGLQRWLACVGFNTLTGRVQPAGDALPVPVLIPVNRVPPGRRFDSPQQHYPHEEQQQQQQLPNSQLQRPQMPPSTAPVQQQQQLLLPLMQLPAVEQAQLSLNISQEQQQQQRYHHDQTQHLMSVQLTTVTADASSSAPAMLQQYLPTTALPQTFTDRRLPTGDATIMQAATAQVHQDGSQAAAAAAASQPNTEIELETAAEHIGRLVQQQQQQQQQPSLDLDQDMLQGSAEDFELEWPPDDVANSMLSAAADPAWVALELPTAASNAAVNAATNNDLDLINIDSVTNDLVNLDDLDVVDELDDLDDLADRCNALNAAQPQLARNIRDLANAYGTLKFQLLEVCAGMYGDNSTAKMQQLLQQVSSHNWSAAQHNRHELVLHPLSVKEDWFLARGPLHLLVSKVRVWGPGGDLRPEGPLPPLQRSQLLQMLLEYAAPAGSTGGQTSILSQALRSRNLNNATPWFTACHFCEPSALNMMIKLPELTANDMLTPTKRGKLFYHITSTEAHNTLDLQHRQQLEQGMRLTLAAFADRWAEFMSQMTPEQVLKFKRRVCAANQRRRQRRQQELCQQLGVQWTPVLSSPTR